MRKTVLSVLLVALLAFAVRPLAAMADPRDFRLHNQGNHSIVGLWVTPHSYDRWGSQVLDEDLDPGYYTDIDFSGDVGTCYYDIRVRYDDGSYGYLYDDNLCENTDYYTHY